MIEFYNVSKTYANGTEALKNINLKIEDGEFVFVVGSSGAGKSTFLKIMMREEVPNSGEVLINGFNLNTMKKKNIPMLRRTMGIVFQDFRLIPTMTVFDNVAFAMRVIGTKEKEIRKRVPYVLSLVGLASKARQLPTQLSGGEQQRVALARALVNNAGILIADEPTGNVDPEMSYEIVDLLNHINANGTTVIMVTHEHNLVRHFHHRVVTIEDGRVVSDTKAFEDLPQNVLDGREGTVAPMPESNTASELEQKVQEAFAQRDAQTFTQAPEPVQEQAAPFSPPQNFDSAFYYPPNQDKELEDFMQNYGVTQENIQEQSIDYAAYLSELDNGGDDQ